MLIQPKTINENDIITIKFVGGDEVIAKFISDGGSNITVRKPLVVMMSQQGFGLAPFSLTSDPDAEVRLSKDHVITYNRTIDAVAKNYIQQTTGLTL